jgi:hypothetical protein
MSYNVMGRYQVSLNSVDIIVDAWKHLVVHGFPSLEVTENYLRNNDYGKSENSQSAAGGSTSW